MTEMQGSCYWSGAFGVAQNTSLPTPCHLPGDRGADGFLGPSRHVPRSTRMPPGGSGRKNAEPPTANLQRRIVDLAPSCTFRGSFSCSSIE